MDSAPASGRRSSGGSINRTVTVRGDRTGMRLEPELWEALDEVCQREGISWDELIRRVREGREHGSRTSAVRAYLVAYFRARGRLAHGDPGRSPNH